MSYDHQFFREQRQQALRSASEIVPIVVEMIQPRSVIDVGCGVGGWLSVFKRHGVSDVVGIDGPWAERENELLAHEFIQHDLTVPFHLTRKFDLVTCLEVAEHLPKTVAAEFIATLVRLGPVVLFSAAVPFQDGTHHINEQWPEYWAKLFREHDYVAIDCLRGQIWNHQRVDWWYAQNSFFCIDRKYLESNPRLSALQRQAAPELLRLIHPTHYLDKARRANIGLAEVIKLFPRLTKEAVARRIKTRFG